MSGWISKIGLTISNCAEHRLQQSGLMNSVFYLQQKFRHQFHLKEF